MRAYHKLPIDENDIRNMHNTIRFIRIAQGDIWTQKRGNKINTETK